MKKNLISAFIFLSVIFCGCAKTNSAKNSAPEKADPEIQKIDIVLSRMSNRAQEEIVISDKKAFLSDLKEVLAFEKQNESSDVDLFYLIDKKHNIGKEYEPKGLVKLVKNDLFNINRNDLSLRPEAYESLKILSQKALDDGIALTVSSTYRSYDYQTRLFQRYVDQDGVEKAERYSARPGTSQHQLGLAIDFGSIDDSFIETRMGKWLDLNASKYGWSLSFPKGYEDITGYQWECWHYRYIGIEACKFQKKYFVNVQQYMLEFIDLWKSL